MKIKKRATEHQILFMLSFLTGIVFITILARGKVPENTLMNQALSQAFLEEGWNRRELFLQCLWNRGIILLAVLSASCTPLRSWVFRAVTIWIGFAFGAMLKLFYLWYGIKGMGLLVVAVLPHYIFYWMAYGLLYWEWNRNSIRIKRNYFPFLLAVGVAIMGIFFESYVNPFLVSGYMKIFF